ncbi:hypothetical protein ONE63_006197 [Megalurothrips usitatus]|uniref:Lipase n=1 Tax=Megalurothrips usitatus TaxID=439358 RepID=A0AAV7XSM1_9NEOP|nr:hypothetical protein ONE63_006197 [Megalurothrips usitatus]
MLAPQEQLIQHWGYPAEVHNIQSEDGYSLCLFRIPWSKESPPPERQGGDKGNASTASRPVVLFQHGLLQSADQWLLRGPGRDLAFMLSDLGYDVWLGNFRGNLYSRKHVHMSTDNDKFWDFSWHENGFYDLAAFIDYALAVSGQRSLSYIGHSMGTTALLVLLSTRPEYNRRVRVASLLAPVAYFGHLRGLLAMALPVCRNLERELRGVHMEVLPRGTVPLGLVGTLCRPGAPPYSVCLNSYMQAVGPDMKQLNATLLPTAMAHLFSGASLGQAVHYVQSYKTGQFRQFDHGVRWNTLRYGHPQPPLYNLSKVVAPIAFHYSTGDYLSHHRDVERLVNEVAGTAGVYRIPWKEFNHGDYMWATDTYDLLYKTVIKVFREHL